MEHLWAMKAYAKVMRLIAYRGSRFLVFNFEAPYDPLLSLPYCSLLYYHSTCES
jgi:hypothetical protein